jgi:tRNA(Ile)-lysidine synthase
MEEAYLEILEKFKNFNGENIIVAVSGGADSISLLHLMIRAKETLNLNVVCAHVNHNIRKESEQEKIFVKNFCDKNGVIFEYMKIENYGDDNFHNEARTKRYDYFEKLIEKYNSKYLLTAHHGDDLIETILMRIVRGSSFKGYSGFSKEVDKGSYKIFRPLITVTKDDIYSYVEKNNLKYVVDQSNFKDVYTRNRYRKYVLPMLKNEDKNVHHKFYKFSKSILEYNDYIEKQAKNIFGEIVNNNKINIEKFLKLDKVISEKIIYMLLEKQYQDDLMLITDKHVELINNLIKSTKSNSYIFLPNNLKGIKSYNEFYIEKLKEEKDSYEIEISENVILPNGKTIEAIDSSEIDDNNICRLNYKDICMPLHVRNRKNGDKISVKGMLGTKKIKDIFIDSKIHSSERDLWPIVVDSTGKIVWIPGLKKSKFNSKKDEKCDIILRYY